jgi:hypothetical protein
LRSTKLVDDLFACVLAITIGTTAVRAIGTISDRKTAKVFEALRERLVAALAQALRTASFRLQNALFDAGSSRSSSGTRRARSSATASAATVIDHFTDANGVPSLATTIWIGFARALHHGLSITARRIVR